MTDVAHNATSPPTRPRLVTYLVTIFCLLLAFSATPWYQRVTLALGIDNPAALSSSDFMPTPYMALNGAVPIHWPTCATIGYRTNLTLAPPDAKKNLDAALALLSRYTHFRFVDLGSTSFVPQLNWASTTLPAPLTIAWASPATSSLLGQSQELAIGSVASSGAPLSQVYVDAVVVVDVTKTRSLSSGTESGGLGLLLLHELSHAIGLAHNHNPHSYMYPYFNVTTQSVTPADVTHLAAEDPAAC